MVVFAVPSPTQFSCIWAACDVLVTPDGRREAPVTSRIETEQAR